MKRRFSLILSIILVLLMITPIVAGAEDTSNPNTQISVSDIEDKLYQYNTQYEWYDEIYSPDFNEFAINFMLGDNYKDIISDDTEYTILRTYFANYLALLDGQNEDEVASSLLHFRDQSIGDFINQAETLNSEISVLQRSIPTTFSASYNTSNAIQFARKYALDTSLIPYYPFGDCTNFASNCLYAGGISQVYNPSRPIGTSDTTRYWYSYNEYVIEQVNTNISTSWMRVSDFITYWSGKVAVYSKLSKSNVYTSTSPGDIIFLADSYGTPYHAIFITGKNTSTKDLTYCGHTTNRLDASFNQQASSSDTFYVFKFSGY